MNGDFIIINGAQIYHILILRLIHLFTAFVLDNSIEDSQFSISTNILSGAMPIDLTTLYTKYETSQLLALAKDCTLSRKTTEAPPRCLLTLYNKITTR